MARHVIIRRASGEELVVGETPLPLEAHLHGVLTSHPELLPAEDIGLGQVIVVGMESSLESGRADLVYLDQHGDLCVVEVKKEGNPDTRRVVAQLLDYAAAIWGKTLDEFERDVVLPYLAESQNTATSLRELLSNEFGEGGDANLPADPADISLALEIESTLSDVLLSGEFRLVVAAPVIPEGVQRVLRYMNKQGLRLYGVEVSYFQDGSVECFVPRLVVEPPRPGEGGKTHTSKRKQWSEEPFVEALREQHGVVAADIASQIFAWANQIGLRSNFGSGQDGRYWPGLQDEAGKMYPFSLISSGSVEINFGDMVRQPYRPFDDEERRRELQRKLNAISGVQIPDEMLARWPRFPIDALAGSALNEFFRIIEWSFDETRQAHGDTLADPSGRE